MSDVLPEGWVAERLGSLADRITKGATPTSYGFKFQKEGIRFVKVENLRNGKIDHLTLRDFISAEAHKAQARSILRAGEVLLSIAGTLGESCVVSPEDLPANTNQALAIIRGTDQVLDVRYLRLVLDSEIGRHAVDQKARGGGMNNISLADVSSFNVPVAPLEEQHRIVDKANALLTRVKHSPQSSDEGAIHPTAVATGGHCDRLLRSVD